MSCFGDPSQAEPVLRELADAIDAPRTGPRLPSAALRFASAGPARSPVYPGGYRRRPSVRGPV
jgi:hypothetical protein